MTIDPTYTILIAPIAEGGYRVEQGAPGAPAAERIAIVIPDKDAVRTVIRGLALAAGIGIDIELNEWIRLDEEEPEEGEWVLVYDYDARIGDGGQCLVPYVGGMFFDGDEQLTGVTHFRRLPQNPA